MKGKREREKGVKRVRWSVPRLGGPYAALEVNSIALLKSQQTFQQSFYSSEDTL